MAWPASVLTREIIFGKAVILETGADLSLRTVTRASRSLISLGEGFRMESLVAQYETNDPGEVVAFELPVTNQPGWADAVSRMGIEVGEDEHTHLYTTTLTIYSGTTQVKQYAIGPYPIPMGEGPIDGDTMLVPSETQSGALVPLPDVWAEIVADANALLNLRGEPNGIATLDGAGVVPETQLPERLSEDALKNTIADVVGGAIPEGVVTSNVSGLRQKMTLEGETPEPGDGLVIWYNIPGTNYYVDFADGTIGNQYPGISTAYGSPNALVAEVIGATNDKGLVLTGNPSGYALDAYEDDPHLASVEVLLRFKVLPDAGTGAIATWLGIDPVADSGWRVSYNSPSGTFGTVRITKRETGSNTYIEEVTAHVQSTDWAFMRARLHEGQILGKVWIDGDPEPDWQIVQSAVVMPANADLAFAGHVGSAPAYRLDYAAIATGGRVAIKP